MSDPKSWCTVCPLLNLDTGLKTPVYFAKGLWLTLIPDWLRQDGWTDLLSFSDREVLKQLQYAFIVEYEAASSGAPDPDWQGPEPRSIQDAKHEIVMLANFALWITKPSPVCYELVFHAPRWEDGWNVQKSERYPRIRCHPKDRNVFLTGHDLDRAVVLHSALCALPRKNSIWTAIHSTWTALQTRNTEIRDLLLWIALEALFGPESAQESACRMLRRIGFFVSNDREEARKISQKAEKIYDFMRKTAHGHWTDSSDLNEFGYETETLLRRALEKALPNDMLTRQLCSSMGREPFLDSLISEI